MNEMEARRVVCPKGHTNAMLKTYPGGEGDAFAVAHAALGCAFCGAPLRYERVALEDFERYKSREDGRYMDGVAA